MQLRDEHSTPKDMQALLRHRVSGVVYLESQTTEYQGLGQERGGERNNLVPIHTEKT